MEPAAKDPILGVTEAFLADPSPDKVNVGVVSSLCLPLWISIAFCVFFFSLKKEFGVFVNLFCFCVWFFFFPLLWKWREKEGQFGNFVSFYCCFGL